MVRLECLDEEKGDQVRRGGIVELRRRNV